LAEAGGHHGRMPRFTLRLLASIVLLLAGAGAASAKPTPAEVARRAEEGNAKAQFTLAEMYANGDGVLEDSAEAAKWYRKAAEQSYPRAQAMLGYLYSVGRGVPKDSAEAVKWLRLAAERGNAMAQYNLGLKYAQGDGVPKDSAEAARWYREAADQGTGHAKARFNLGVMYATGEGVPQDSAQAIEWYLKAAELDYAKAEANLGYMYATGNGTRRDPAEAVKWYRKAAEQGDATALYNLGVMAAVGDGVPKDLVQAHVWMNGAGAQGEKDVRPNLEAIEHNMTAEQKAEAKQLASPVRVAEAKARKPGWSARFKPGQVARLDFLADGSGVRPAEETPACFFVVWVAPAGPEAEVEISPADEGAANAKPETYKAVVLQRTDEMVVLKLVMKSARQAESVQIYTLFPKTGQGFISTTNAAGPSHADPRDGSAGSAETKASGSVTPLTRVDQP